MDMNQISLGLNPLPEKTRKEVFLDEMNQVVPWNELVALVQPHARGTHQALASRPPFPIDAMLSIHRLQLSRNRSDPAMEEELHEHPLCQRFAGLDGATGAPDETTFHRFRRLLEKHQAKKGNRWQFGMKAHIDVTASVNEVTPAATLLHGERAGMFADAGSQGVDKRVEAQALNVNWHTAMRLGKRRALDTTSKWHRPLEKMEHSFRVVKQQFGYAKVGCRSLAKNAARLTMLCSLSSLWMARCQLLGSRGMNASAMR